MADYQYIGLAVYIKENEENMEKLNVLASAIGILQYRVADVSFDQEKYQDIVESDAFRYLHDHDYVCSPHNSEVPRNTPEKYIRVAVDGVNIKGVSMLKIYVPAVAKDEDLIRYFIYNALHPVLINIFQNDIMSMKTKEGIEYEDFQDGKETILIPVKDKVKQPA